MQSHKWQDIIIYVGTSIVLILCSLMMVAWYAHISWLIELAPKATPIQFNTALALFVIAIGILTTRRNPILAGLLGVAVTSIAGLTVFEYLFTVNLHLDELFIRPFTTIRTPFPGRPAPNTAISLIILGSLLFFRLPLFNFRIVQTLGVFWALLVIFIGANAFVGYLLGISSAYGWGMLMYMSPFSAFSILVSGVCLFYIYFVWDKFVQNDYQRILILPITIAAIGISLFLILWQYLIQIESQKINIVMSEGINSLKNYFNRNIEIYYSALDRIRKRQSINLYQSPDEFKFEAASYLEDLYGFEAMSLYSFEKGFNAESFAKNQITKENVSNLRQCAAAVKTSNKDNLFLLSDNKNLCIPFIFKDKHNFTWFLLAVMNLEKIIIKAADQHLKLGFGIILSSEDKIIFKQENNVDYLKSKWKQSINMPFKNLNLVLEIWPNKKIISDLSNNLPLISFIIGNIVTFLLATTVWLLSLAKLNQKILIQRENQLSLLTQKLELIMNSSHLSIIATDLNGIIVNFNRAAERITGYLANEVIGKQTPEIFHDPDEIKKYAAELFKKYGRFVQPNFRVFVEALEFVDVDEHEWTYIRKNGERVTVLLSITGIKKSGILTGYVGVALDITERKALEKMKNEFISVISHELRTPLTSIQGSIVLLTSKVMGDLPSPVMDLLTIAQRNTERLVRLINDILDLNKIEEGRMQFHLAPVELNALIEESVITNKPFADKFSVSLVFNQLPSSIFVNVDRDRLLQVLANLISNAIKFSKKNGVVTLAIELLDETSVRVKIIDQGVGIPESFQPRIFHKFSQADSSAGRGQPGTGLGLAISKNIIKSLGGTINFKSKEHEGSTFYFDLPIIKS